jgi:hypothetical protein
MEYYQRVQYGFLILVPTTFLTLVLGGIGTVTANYFLFGLGLLFLLISSLFYRLVVTVTESAVRVKYGIGLIRKSIPLAQVVSAEPVRNSWWYGWGIRIYPKGWLFNIAGLDAVELQMKRGPRFRIGTNDPVGLTGALQSRLRQLSQ